MGGNNCCVRWRWWQWKRGVRFNDINQHTLLCAADSAIIFIVINVIARLCSSLIPQAHACMHFSSHLIVEMDVKNREWDLEWKILKSSESGQRILHPCQHVSVPISWYYITRGVIFFILPCFQYVRLSRCPLRCPVPPSAFLFRFARIMDGIRWYLRKVITGTSRWTDYSLGEVEPGTTEQDKTENSNRRQTGVFSSPMRDNFLAVVLAPRCPVRANQSSISNQITRCAAAAVGGE